METTSATSESTWLTDLIALHASVQSEYAFFSTILALGASNHKRIYMASWAAWFKSLGQDLDRCVSNREVMDTTPLRELMGKKLLEIKEKQNQWLEDEKVLPVQGNTAPKKTMQFLSPDGKILELEVTDQLPNGDSEDDEPDDEEFYGHGEQVQKDKEGKD